MDLISVIVPVYNVEKYLNRCVDSIINQTYKNLEIILVDDGSPDNCGVICDEYAKKDKRIKVIHKENGGLSSARNAGLDIATGDYIGFVDSDDSIDADMYEELYSNLKKYDCELSICGMHNISEFRKSDSNISERKVIMNNYELIEKYIRTDLIHTVACNKLFSKELFSNLRFRVGIIHEDEEIMYKILSNVKNAVHIGTAKYIYYLRDNSITSEKYNSKKMIRNKISDERYEFFKGLYPDFEKDLYDIRILTRIHLLISIITTGSMKENEKDVKEIRAFLKSHTPYDKKLCRKKFIYNYFLKEVAFFLKIKRFLRKTVKKIIRFLGIKQYDYNYSSGL